MSVKSPIQFDVELGRKVRIARMSAQMSQEELGRKLSLTFQQIQKYEKGVNRICARRLKQIAEFTNMKLSWFFDNDWDIGCDISLLDAEALRFAENVSKLPIEMRRVLANLAQAYVSAQHKIPDHLPVPPDLQVRGIGEEDDSTGPNVGMVTAIHP